MAVFGQISFDRYLDRLTDRLRSKPFAKDIARQIPELDSDQAVRSFASKLVARARALGIECEGDVTPFCLLAVCMDDEFRQSGIYPWVCNITR